MEPESQTTQLPEARPVVGDPASQIYQYTRAIERLTWLSQEEYKRLKHEGDHLGAAKIDCYLAKIECHVRSTIHLLHSATMNELGKDGLADLQQSLTPVAIELMELQQSHENCETKNEEVQTKHGEQHHNCGSRLQKAQLDAASANRACNQARRQIGDLQAQLAAANEQLNRVDSLKCCICHDSFVTKKSSCSHLFCEDCIDNWANRVNTLSYPTPWEEARGDTEETRKVLLCPVCKQDTFITRSGSRVLLGVPFAR
jgi:hypothetical protein